MYNKEKVCYLVEANRFEELTLFEKYSCSSKKCVEWENLNNSVNINIGTIDNRPICISLRFIDINSRLVIFWEATSQLVDFKLIENYFKKEMPQLFPKNKAYFQTDANNFHLCIQHIKYLNSSKHKLKENVNCF